MKTENNEKEKIENINSKKVEPVAEKVDFDEKLKELENENRELKDNNKDGAIKSVDYQEKIDKLESGLNKALDIGTEWKNKYLDLKDELNVENKDDEKREPEKNPFGIRE